MGPRGRKADWEQTTHMAIESVERTTSGTGWKTAQVYTMAGFCLVMGLLLGYLFRGSASPKTPVVDSALEAVATAPATGANTPAAQQMPSLDQMKQMADKKAAPLLAKLQTDPNDSALLNDIARIYKLTHQFKPAVEYYQKAIQADPKNVGARTDLASCLYYQGDIKGAISQLEQSLQYNPKDANTLFNLGMIRWQAKNDTGGAIKAWQQLLKSNPKLADDRKAEVEKLIAQAKQHGANNLRPPDPKE